MVVQRAGGDGGLEDVPYDIAFAFAFHAFPPGAADPHKHRVRAALVLVRQAPGANFFISLNGGR